MNPVLQLRKHGQSVWLDYIRRHLITSGDLRRLVESDGLGGLTSNPAIFEKAIAGSSDYHGALRQFAVRGGCDSKTAYESLAIEDVRDAAAVLREVYDATHGRDGYVSFEVSPLLAHDTDATVAEARRLWSALGSPNVMIKVPATAEGIPAVRSLIADGINVNVTLLFSQEAYEAVADAFMSGLEARAARGGDISGVAGVASFFISRIDVAADARIAERAKDAPTAAERAAVEGLSGTVAIANAKLAYQRYRAIVRTARWEALAARGARSQRLLWASTGSKNPAHRDVLYVEELVGPETVNTMPPATLDAVRDHGVIRPSLEEGVEEARRTVAALANAGISLDEITTGLLTDALRLFEEPFHKLLGVIDDQLRAARPAAVIDRQTFSVPAAIRADVDAALDDWQARGSSRRLWARDAGLWTGATSTPGWAGWISPTLKRRTSTPCAARPPRFARTDSRPRFSSAWGAPACARRCSAVRSGDRTACRISTCWTRPTRRRSPGRWTPSTSRARWSSYRASRAARSNPTSSSSTSSDASRRPSAPMRRRHGSSPSPIRDPRCSSSRNVALSGRCSRGDRASAGGIRPFPISAWHPRRSWALTWPGCSIARATWCRAARRACRHATIPASCSASSSGILAKHGRDKVTIVASRPSRASGPGWSSCWPNRWASKAKD